MTISQIECFLNVVKTGSFSAAAKKMYVTQPAVSKLISQLEQELGFELFIRVGKTIHLSDEGRQMYSCLYIAYNQVNSTIERIRSGAAGQDGRLRLGCIDTWDVSVFYDRLSDCLEKSGYGRELQILAYAPDDLPGALRHGEVDMILASDSINASEPGGINEPVCRLRCGILYSRLHFHGGGLDDFSNANIFIPSRDRMDMNSTINALLAKYDVLKGSRVPCRYNDSVMSVMCGHGVMVVSQLSNLVGSRALGYLPVDIALPISLSCFPHSGNVRLAKLFAPVIAEACAGAL